MPPSPLVHAPRLRRAACCAAILVVTASCSSATATSTGTETEAAPSTSAVTQAKVTPSTVAVERTTTTVVSSRPRLHPLFGPRLPLPLALHHVTRDADTDRYELHQQGNAIVVAAPASNRSTPDGSATRAVIWAPQSARTEDATTCATWTRSEPWGQEGLALRISAEAERFRAIVIAKNTVFGAAWQFNVYSWDSARDPYFQIHGAVDLAPVFADGSGRPDQLPWRVCARTEGARVRVKGWDTDQPQPGWRVTASTGTVDLPADLVYAGNAGWYAAHIDPGEILALAELRAYARSMPR